MTAPVLETSDEDIAVTPPPRSEPAAAPPRGDVPHVRIRAATGWVSLNLAELWRYRELMGFLAWRDIKVRYKQTALGAAWAVLVPLLTMVIFNVLFALLLGGDKMPTVAGVPYSISTLCALVPWQLFSNCMNTASNSIVNSRNLITKVYFPRLITPIAPVLAALVDFVIAAGLLAVIIAGYDLFTDYDFHFSWAILALPGFVLLSALLALGLSLWLSALNAVYRDIRYALPFIVQILMYVSPVLYNAQSITHKLPAWAQVLYGLNPLVGVMEGFRWALLGGVEAPGLMLIPSTLMTLAVLVGGLYYFRRMERTFADLA